MPTLRLNPTRCERSRSVTTAAGKYKQQSNVVMFRTFMSASIYRLSVAAITILVTICPRYLQRKF